MGTWTPQEEHTPQTWGHCGDAERPWTADGTATPAGRPAESRPHSQANDPALAQRQEERGTVAWAPRRQREQSKRGFHASLWEGSPEQGALGDSLLDALICRRRPTRSSPMGVLWEKVNGRNRAETAL